MPDIREPDNGLPKVFVFCNDTSPLGCIGVALAEDGTYLAGHASSSEAWLKHDMGVTGTWKHDKYSEHYPGGYEVVYVPEDEVKAKSHAGLEAAYNLHQALPIPESADA